MMAPTENTRFVQPPRPTRTLAQLRREDQSAWQVLQWFIREWIKQVLPESIPGDFAAGLLPAGICPVLDGNLAGEAKHEAIEHLLDKGYLRFQIRRRNRPGRFKFQMQVWIGRRYRPVGGGKRS